MKTTCADCGKTWGGTRASHCTVCCQTFSSEASGDKHRRGDYPHGRYCSTEGLEYNPKRDMWKTPGTWIPGDGETQGGPSTPETTTDTHRHNSEPHRPNRRHHEHDARK